MSRKLRFHDDALAEITRAADWYDRQRQGLGAEFLDALQVRLLQLVDMPSLGGRFLGAAADVPARRLLLTRFPYLIEVGDEMRVIAVLHRKRRPGSWMKRIEK